MFDQKFFEEQLNKVSRSFAFCIAELRNGFREKVTLAYLLFRVLDTIEDSHWESADSQKTAFQIFRKLFYSHSSVKEFENLFNNVNITPEERILIETTHTLLESFFELTTF